MTDDICHTEWHLENRRIKKQYINAIQMELRTTYTGKAKGS